MRMALVDDCLQYITSGVQASIDFGNLIVDFLEDYFGMPIDNLPDKASLSVQQIHIVQLLGRCYGDNGKSWIRFATLSSNELLIGAIKHIISVRDVLYFVVAAYSQAETANGALVVPSGATPTEIKVSLLELAYINTLWRTSGTAAEMSFVEIPH